MKSFVKSVDELGPSIFLKINHNKTLTIYFSISEMVEENPDCVGNTIMTCNTMCPADLYIVYMWNLKFCSIVSMLKKACVCFIDDFFFLMIFKCSDVS